MTKALLNIIKTEFEHTEPDSNPKEHITRLCEKYKCTTKDLKGYTTWKKDSLDNIDTSIKLVYETLYSPNIEDYIEQDPEVIEAEIITTAKDIQEQKPVSKDSLPQQAKDGFEGLRLLDTKLQTQALGLLRAIDDHLGDCETAKDVRDLVAAHTAIRDSYFNTKAPMVNILNGDVVKGDKNELATLLEGAQDDC